MEMLGGYWFIIVNEVHELDFEGYEDVKYLRKIIMILLFNNKKDIQSCSN